MLTVGHYILYVTNCHTIKNPIFMPKTIQATIYFMDIIQLRNTIPYIYLDSNAEYKTYFSHVTICAH